MWEFGLDQAIVFGTRRLSGAGVGMMVLMDPSSRMTTGPAGGVARLVLLAFTLAGVVAMHGLASIDAAGFHRSAVAVVLAPPDHESVLTVETGRHAAASAVDRPQTTVVPGGEHGGHELMAGCVVVLLGLLVGVGFRASSGGGAERDLVRRIVARFVRTAPRGPPPSIFLSLCVFRR